MVTVGERQTGDAEAGPTEGLPGGDAAARGHDPEVGSDIAIIIAAAVSARR